MNRIFHLGIAAAAAIFMLAGCNKSDIDDLKSRQSDLEKRVEKLEEWSKSVNTNIGTLQSLVNAMQENKFISSVNAKEDGSGYTITFDDRTSVEILHGAKGEVPVIGVKQFEDGKYYWTINGEYMLTAADSGEKICAEGQQGEDAVAPQVRINETSNKWEISTDGGENWTSTGVKATGEQGDKGQQGDAIFAADGIDMVSKPGYVTFTLANEGGTLTIPLASNVIVAFESYETMNVYENGVEALLVFPATINEGDIKAIMAQVTNNAGTSSDVKVSRAYAPTKWDVEVIMPTFSEGVLVEGSAKVKVTAPEGSIGEGAILKVTVVDNQGKESTASRALISQTAVTAVNTVEEANEKMSEVLNDPAKNAVVQVDKKVETSTTIEIPASAQASSLTLSFDQGIAADQTLTIEDKGNFSGQVNITVPEENAANLVILTPSSTVTLNGKAVNLTASTAENTLVIAEGSAVTGTLTVTGGNVKIFGSVAGFGEIAPESKIFWSAGTAEELRTALAKEAKYNHGVILTADINGVTGLTGNQQDQDLFHIGSAEGRSDFYQSTDYDGYVLDGNGFSISGAAYNNLLAVYAHNVVIKNLTLKQSAADKAKKKNSGMTIYRSKGVRLENVTISECGKAGIIVNASTAVASGLTVSNCAWGGVDVSKGSNPEGGERPEFTLESGSFTVAENTFPIYVSQNTVDDYNVTVPAGWNEAEVFGMKVYSPSPLKNIYSGQKIAELIAAAPDNGVITLPIGEFYITSPITVNKPVTIDGGGQNVNITGQAGFDVQANLALNNIALDCNTPMGTAPVTITKAGVQFTADKLILNQAAVGTTGNAVANHTLGIYVLSSPDVDNVKLTLTNSHINLNGNGMQMGVVLGATDEGQSNLELDMTDCYILSPAIENYNASRTFGVHIGEVEGAKVSLKNCKIEEMHYPVRGRDVETTSTLELLVDNTVLTGYCAIAMRGIANVTVQNGSVLTGRNYYTGGSSNFATIAFQDGSDNSTLIVDNSTITNIVTGDCDEDLISIRANKGMTITLRNNAKLIDDPNSTKPLAGMIYRDLKSDSKVISDETVQLIGKEGVKLEYQ